MPRIKRPRFERPEDADAWIVFSSGGMDSAWCAGYAARYGPLAEQIVQGQASLDLASLDECPAFAVSSNLGGGCQGAPDSHRPSNQSQLK